MSVNIYFHCHNDANMCVCIFIVHIVSDALCLCMVVRDLSAGLVEAQVLKIQIQSSISDSSV